MSPLILTLVFATAIGFFMIQPANQLANWLLKVWPNLEGYRDTLMVGLTLALAFTAGVALALF